MVSLCCTWFALASPWFLFFIAFAFISQTKQVCHVVSGPLVWALLFGMNVNTLNPRVKFLLVAFVDVPPEETFQKSAFESYKESAEADSLEEPPVVDYVS